MFKIEVIVLIGVIIFLIYMNDTNYKTKFATNVTTTPATRYTPPATNVTTTPATRYTPPATSYTPPATSYTPPADIFTPIPIADNNNESDISKLPNNIQKILFDLEQKSPKDKDGNIKPSKKNLMILVNAIIQEVDDTKEFVKEILNAPKDIKGKPMISEKKEQLFNLMLAIFMMTNGTIFSNEFLPLFTNLKNPN